MAAPAGRHACPSSTASTARPRGASSTRRSPASTTPGSTRPQTRALLEAYGIPLVPERVAATPTRPSRRRASSASRSSSRPPPPARTRPRRGGVALDLARRGRRSARRSSGSARRCSSSRTSRGGAELLAGVVQDPVFGPLVAFGPGGVFAELIGDAPFRIAPLTDVDAEELVTRRQGRAGSSPASAAPRRPTPRALVDLVHRLGRLAEDVPEVAELDLNPVLAGPDGCVAVDARVRLRSRAERDARSRAGSGPEKAAVSSAGTCGAPAGAVARGLGSW